MQLPAELQKELVEKAAARYGNCQELAKHLNIPKSSVHYYRIGRLTMPVSVLEQMMNIADDPDLREKVESREITKDRTWANEHAVSIFREICRERLNLPTRQELEGDDSLRRKAAAIVSYAFAEGSVWMQKNKWGEHAANITFAQHENDLYEHFRALCEDVFKYDIGPPQEPGNGAKAIRGFIYSRFVAEWLVENGVYPGDKSAIALHLPNWIMRSQDPMTWRNALQPWCDGEGCVSGVGGGFSIAQSRHTNLDTEIIPRQLIPPTRRDVTKRTLEQSTIFGQPAIEYLEIKHRSEILDDVAQLFSKLEFDSIPVVKSLALKDDGFYSCIWELRFCKRETSRLVSLGLITQTNKILKWSGTGQ